MNNAFKRNLCLSIKEVSVSYATVYLSVGKALALTYLQPKYKMMDGH